MNQELKRCSCGSLAITGYPHCIKCFIAFGYDKQPHPNNYAQRLAMDKQPRPRR